MVLAGIILVTLFVGFICGCTSVGGVLLIPSLAALSGLPLRTVMGTALFSFFFSGLVGTWMHARAGRLDLRCLPLCVGALLCGYPGALAKHAVSLSALNAILGLLIVVAGVSSLRTVRGSAIMDRLSPRLQKAVLFAIGGIVAFLCSMTGAGGPVLSVPIMLMLGYPALFCIASAIPLQVAITFSGSIGNMVVGDIDYQLALWVTLMMMAGAAIGTWSIRYFRPDPLKLAVSVICIATGLYMTGRSVLG